MAYQRLERPYTRISKYNKKNFVRGGYPHLKITKFEMGDPRAKFDTILTLHTLRSMQIRQNALESARTTSNRVLEKVLGKNYFIKLLVYPFHVLRENPLAAGAGADRMSTGMQKAFGKVIGSAAQITVGQALFEVRLPAQHVKLGQEALRRAATKMPCSCKIKILQ